MKAVPTRWRTAIEDQLADAEQRINRARRHVNDGDGSRAMQEAYPAVVAAGTIRVWQEAPPWESPVAPDVMQRRVREAFPSLFAALAEMDLQEVLTSPWQAKDATPYVAEAEKYLEETRQQVHGWLERA
jgi:hypothetical protein